MEIEGDHELSRGRKAKAARTEKLPPAVEGEAEGVSSPSAPDKVKALFTGAVMTPELAPKSTLQEEGNLPAVGAPGPAVVLHFFFSHRECLLLTALLLPLGGWSPTSSSGCADSA